MTHTAERPVLAGVDGSDAGLSALRWATDEARRRSAPLWVVHAFDLVPPEFFALEDPAYVAAERGAAEKVLDAAVRQARELAGDIEVRPVLQSGAASAVLLAQSAQADLVVLGSRGRGGFASLLLGSTSLQVASHASCVVVVVRASAEDVAAGPSAGRIVVGADGSPHSEGALGFAVARGQERGLGVTAVRAWRPPAVYLDAVASPDWEQAEKYEQEALAGTVAAWRDRHPGVDIVEKTVMGDPAKALIDESAGAELLVVGSHGRGELRGLVLGSVSHAVLHHAHCPVAVTRH